MRRHKREDFEEGCLFNRFLRERLVSKFLIRASRRAFAAQPVQEHYLSEMARDKVLGYLYPEQTVHPLRAYRTPDALVFTGESVAELGKPGT